MNSKQLKELKLKAVALLNRLNDKSLDLHDVEMINEEANAILELLKKEVKLYE